MNHKLGSKNGKNNRRLFFLNRKRKIKLENQDLREKKEKEEKIETKKKEQEIIFNYEKNINIDNQVTKPNQEPTITTEKTYENPQEIIPKNNNYNIKKEKDLEEKIIDNLNTLPTPKKEIELPIDKPNDEFIEKDIKSVNFQEIDNPKKEDKKIENINVIDKDYLEKQIIKILEKQIDDDRYSLKKIDSEIYTIQKELDNINDKDDLEDIQKEIEILTEKLNQIKKQIESLEKTFEFNIPEEPDNYLIYLVDEFKTQKESKKELSDKLKYHKEFQSIIDKIIEIEEKQTLILEKTQDKKNKLKLDDDKIKKLNDNIINIEEMKIKINEMLKKQTTLLEEIRIKVDETVHISEKVDYITKSVNHSLFELFILMKILKHNLSLKNNAIAAVSAKVALDMILKMTTPIKEKVITQVSDVKDYENLINNCLNDTNQLENIINENLENISSIRYTFEHNYKEYSYLPSYQEATLQLTKLESEIKERKNDVLKIKKETEMHLEKNNNKVNKYSSTNM